jgi:hypothetical protein
MSQSNFSIANQLAGPARAAISAALQALASNSSGATAPSTTYANMPWYDTSTNIFKMRNEADDAWIELFYLDQAAGKIHLISGTEVTDNAGVKEGILGIQDSVTWNGGVGTDESLISPVKLHDAVLTYGMAMLKQAAGVGQVRRVFAAVGATLVAPSGGTWVVAWHGENTNGVITNNGVTEVGGGGYVAGPAAGLSLHGIAFRIA